MPALQVFSQVPQPFFTPSDQHQVHPDLSEASGKDLTDPRRGACDQRPRPEAFNEVLHGLVLTVTFTLTVNICRRPPVSAVSLSYGQPTPAAGASTLSTWPVRSWTPAAMFAAPGHSAARPVNRVCTSGSEDCFVGMTIF